LVKGCINSFKYTTKKCKLFKFPKDELMSKQWLINCNRKDLIGKSLEYFKVCSDHFLECMYKTAEKKVLLPHAVPTDFTMIPKKDSCTTTACQDTSISNPISNASVSTSTPLNQEESFSYSCLPSQSTSCSTDQPMSSSTQTTQLLSLHTPRKQKYRAQLQNIKNKYEQLEQKFEALSQEVHKKSCANEIDVTSVELFNRVVEAQLPPNLSMVIKQYVQMGKRKPQGVRYSNEIKQLALTIFFFGPQVYTFLKTLLLLPSPRTLRRITQKIIYSTWIK
ncbi:uncharacterized protein LOC126553035, partial [Aphis gossypii]|uniref:uncharacterized protein LOC126553035 n=1 Tax=Aphis gossypii TaxID=80765 RepID=UPI0021594689